MTLPFIDGLRGISILLVLWIHLSIQLLQPYTFPQSHELFWAATYGVRLFFIVSAYTLFRSHSRRIHTEAKPIWNFYVRRAFRILPLYWAWVTLFGIWGPGSHDLRSISATLFFYMAVFRGRQDYPEVWRGAWSIYVEESFYAVFPLLYRFVDSLPKAFLWANASWGLASLWELYADRIHFQRSADFVSLFPLDNFFCFFLGIFIFHLESSGHLRRLKDLSWTLLRSIDLLVLIAISELMTRGHRYATLALGLVFLNSLSERTLFGKIARAKIIQRFGVCCFSLYLMNQFLLALLQRFFMRASSFLHLPASNEFQTLFWMPWFAGLMLLLGTLSFRYLERPAIELGKKIIARGHASSLRASTA